MTLVRFEPFRGIESMLRRFNELFDELDAPCPPGSSWEPSRLGWM
jgi:hypothetical protein